MIALFGLLLFFAAALYLIAIFLQERARVGELKSRGFPVAPWLPLVGSVPYGVQMCSTDGFDLFFRTMAKKFNHKPFVVPLMGREVFVVVTEPRVCLEILRRPNELVRDAGFSYDAPAVGVKHELLFANYGPSWEVQRAKANPFFRPSLMRGLFDMIVRTVQDREASIMESISGGTERDLRQDCARVTMRIIANHIFGHPLALPSEDLLVEFFLSLLPQEYQLRVGGLWWLPLFSRVKFFRHRSKALAAVVEEIKHAGDGTFCQLLPEEDMEQKLADVMGILFAGFETTSSSVTWALYFLSHLPNERAAIIAELDAALQGRHIDELTFADVKACPLLLAALYESLRLRPPAPGHPGTAICNVELDQGRCRIPKGTVVYAFYSCFLVSEEFFDRPQEYDLRRWIDGRAEAAAAKAGLSLAEFFTPFLVGQHTCLGRPLAELEGQILLARWVYNFEFRYSGTTPPQQVLSVAFAPNQMPMQVVARR